MLNDLLKQALILRVSLRILNWFCSKGSDEMWNMLYQGTKD